MEALNTTRDSERLMSVVFWYSKGNNVFSGDFYTKDLAIDYAETMKGVISPIKVSDEQGRVLCHWDQGIMIGNEEEGKDHR